MGLCGAGLFLAAALLLGPGGRDDVYKTLWPAEALAERGEIINYNGESLEQSSSLLHVLFLASIKWMVGGRIETLNLILNIFCGILGVFLGIALARRLGLEYSWMLALAIGGQGMWVYWAMGGLDAVLVGDCWLLFVWSLLGWKEDGRWRWLPVAVVLLVLARPENGPVAMGALIAYWVVQLLQGPKSILDARNKRLLVVLGMVAGAFGLLVGWRIAHGGHWLPQSALAKADGMSWSRAKAGLGYLGYETFRHLDMMPLWLGLLAGSLQAGRAKSNAALQMLLAVLGAGLGFVVLSGGDWMENGRFLVPFIPLLILQMYLQIARLSPMLQSVAKWAYLVVSIGGLLWISAHFNTGYSILNPPQMTGEGSATDLSFAERNNKVHLRDAFPYSSLLEEQDRIFQAKGDKVVILSQQAGFMMFRLAQERFGKFRFVDLVGLCTTDFTDCAVTQGRGRMRGGLNMDLVYLFHDLQRLESVCGFERPDIVFGLDDEESTLSTALESHGYQIISLQTGTMPQGDGLFKGMEISAIEFVAVAPRWRKSATIRLHKIKGAGSGDQGQNP